MNMKGLKISRRTEWARTYRWPIYSFIAGGLWNLVGPTRRGHQSATRTPRVGRSHHDHRGPCAARCVPGAGISRNSGVNSWPTECTPAARII